MLITEGELDGAPVVALQGRLDSRAAEACAAALLPRMTPGAAPLAIDLAGVDYLGAAGLRILLLLAARGETLGSRLQLHGPRQSVRDVLAVSGLAQRFDLGKTTPAGETSETSD